jgi:uncharacterized protein (TIGR01777 family)
MKVLLTGATGFVGKHLVRKLLEKGHDVAVLTRQPQAVREKLGLPVQAFAWDAIGPVPIESLAGVNAVIHLAGEGVAEHRWSDDQKKKIYESRVLGTRQLMTAISQLPENDRPESFVSASAIGYYGDCDNELLDETSALGKGFLAEVCRDWEAELFTKSPTNLRTAAVRIGMVLGLEGGALKKLLPLFSTGAGGPVGSGRQWVSWIHIDDLVALFVHLLETKSASGVFNGVAPNPVTNADFSHALGKVLHRPAFVKAPAFAVKLIMGEAAELVLASTRVLPKQTLASGFHFTYPTIEEALGAVVEKKSPNGCRELKVTQWLPVPVEKVFPFFCDETNLERLTPPWLNFRVVGKSTPHIEKGTLIDYQLKLHGVPVRWQSRIDDWIPNEMFIDRQMRGPYRFWHHTHRFYPVAGGTLIEDHVLYQVPGGRVGNWFVGPWVKGDVEKIFAYRRQTIDALFPAPTSAS